MTDRRRPESEILPETLSKRVLARASELDAAQRSGSPISDLRAAAAEAGISTSAFDAALAEVQNAESAPVPAVKGESRRRLRLSAAVVAIVALVAGTAIGFGRTVAPVPVSTIEQTFNLRCLASDRAVALLRPLLDAGTAVVIPSGVQGVLTVRTTPARMATIRAALAQYDGVGGPACPKPPTAP